jgi:hypothetical protein
VTAQLASGEGWIVLDPKIANIVPVRDLPKP